MILVIHAYSRGNSGDGLLVDLTLEALSKSVGDQPIVIAAMDPESFSDLPDVVPSAFGVGGTWGRIRSASVLLAKVVAYRALGQRFRLGRLSDLMDQAQLIVAVGGGYMRASNCFEGLKTTVAHSSVALAARWSGKPTVYLPQSVGPFRGPLGDTVRDALSEISCLLLRDDRSISECGKTRGVERIPDLAVIKLAGGAEPSAFPSQYSQIYLVARELDKSPAARERYLRDLNRLRERLPHARPVVQSNVRGNDDAAYYRRIGWGDDLPTLKEAIAKDGRGVVISVRLHGALQSLISGCPAVHLSYERKGFGAYEDLGVSEYVHCATGFDADLVADQALALCQDAAPFWGAISNATGRIRAAEQKMLQLLSNAYNGELVN